MSADNKGTDPSKKPDDQLRTKAEAQANRNVGVEYKIDDAGIHLLVEVKLPKVGKDPSGMVFEWKPLANFGGRIIEDIDVQVDYGDAQRIYVIEAQTPSGIKRFRVTADEFAEAAWWNRHLGSIAMVKVAPNSADHIRNAIKQHSSPEKVIEFERVGWIEVDGEFHYCHADGLISPPRPQPAPKRTVENSPETAVSMPSSPVSPPRPRITSRLPKDLQCFSLPIPDRQAAKDKGEIDLPLYMLMDCVRPAIAVLVGAVFRSVLSPSELSAFLVGPTGSYKTSIALLFQQFFGETFSRDLIPASWFSTMLSNLVKASIVRNAILLIDDFNPTGSAADVARMNRDAESLIRARANVTARSRCGPDHQLKPGRRPHATLTMTGEDLPIGESLQPRFVTARVRKGEIPRSWLDLYQPLADDGAFARVMAVYIEWVAEKRVKEGWSFLDEDFEWLRSEVDRLYPDLHGRQQKMLIDLMVGWLAYLRFREETTGEPMPAELPLAPMKLICEAISTHHAIIEDKEPAYRFCQLLLQAFDAGMAHLVLWMDNLPLTADLGAKQLGYRTEVYEVDRPVPTDRDDEKDDSSASSEPPNEDVEMETVERHRYIPQGLRIGWVKRGFYFLHPELAMKVVRNLAAASGEPLSLTQVQLGERLFNQGVIAKREKGRFTTRLTVDDGQQKRLWQFSPDGIERLMQRAGDYEPATCQGCLCNLIEGGPCERNCPDFLEV